jgi:hypothetical protein
MSPSSVWNLITQNKWDAVRERIGTHPSEATCPIHKPLHIAIRQQQRLSPPLDIISSLLSLLFQKRKLTECDKLELLTDACYNPCIHGNIVLLLLETFQLKPSMEFVFRLIKDILPFQKEHNQHQFCTTQALIQYWPLVLSITDKNGNLLLHHACNKGQYSIGIIRSMIETSLQLHLHYHIVWKEGNHSYDNYHHHHCIRLFYKHYEDDPKDCKKKYYYHGGLLTLNRQQRTPLQNLCRILTDDNDENKHNNQRTLDKLLLCHNLCPNIPILHAGITSVAKPKYFHMLVTTLDNNGIINRNKNYYYDYWTSWKDHNHKSLIEVAIHHIIKNNHSNTTTCNTTNTSSTFHIDNKTQQQSKDIIEIIAETKSLSSNNDNTNKSLFVHSKDDNNRLPLHYACELGLSWDGGLKDILFANRNAVQVMDGKTLLYPFMLAAVSSESKKDYGLEDSSKRTDGKQCDINVIYQLLRRYPNIITMTTKHNKC